MAGRLEGKVAVVVGGGQTRGRNVGNGRACAITYAREGATVLVADRDEEAAQETVAAIEAEGGAASAARVDVAVEADIVALVRHAAALHGRVDVLQTNVGISASSVTEQLSLDDWNRVVSVNLTGTWLCCKHFLPAMREAGRGAVLTVSSLSSLQTMPAAVVYATTKAAVNSLTRTLAREYAPHGVRVNCLLPGAIDTPMAEHAVAAATGLPYEQTAAARAAAVPLGRQGTAWDVANAALFLVSDEAAYITGVALSVDGGSALL